MLGLAGSVALVQKEPDDAVLAEHFIATSLVLETLFRQLSLRRVDALIAVSKSPVHAFQVRRAAPDGLQDLDFLIEPTGFGPQVCDPQLIVRQRQDFGWGAAVEACEWLNYLKAMLLPNPGALFGSASDRPTIREDTPVRAQAITRDLQ